MGLFLCKTCNKQLSLNGHTCEKEDIEKYIDFLEDVARKAQGRANNMEDQICKLITSLPSLDEEYVKVDIKWIRELWKTAKMDWCYIDTADTFLSAWLVMKNLLSRSFDLFRPPRYNFKKINNVEKLQALKEACEKASKIFGYKDTRLEINPEDIVK